MKRVQGLLLFVFTWISVGYPQQQTVLQFPTQCTTTIVAGVQNLTCAPNGSSGINSVQWQRQGIVIAPSSSDPSPQVQEVSAIYDSSPEILTSYSKVVKLVWTCGWWPVSGGGTGTGICGGESPDGITPPTRLSVEPIIPNHGRSWLMTSRVNGNLVLYATNLTNGQLDIYTGTTLAGLTLANSNVLSCGGNGYETANSLGNVAVWIESGSNWSMLYDCQTSQSGNNGSYTIWLATSTNSGVTWAKYGTSPVIGFGSGVSMGGNCDDCSGAYVVNIGGTLHAWVHGGLAGLVPTPYIYHLVDATGTGHGWVADASPAIQAQTYDEGLGLANGQIADAYLLDMGSLNRTILYYSAYTNGCPNQTTCLTPSYIKAATVNYPLATVVTTPQQDGLQNRSIPIIQANGNTSQASRLNLVGINGITVLDNGDGTYFVSGTTYQTYANFSGPAGTPLISSYTDQYGHTFTAYSNDGASPQTPATLDGNGHAIATGGTGTSYADLNSTLTPSSANYTVSATCNVFGSGSCAVWARASNAANTNYYFGCATTPGGGCSLYRQLSGALQLGTTYSLPWGSGTHTLGVRVNGTSISALVDGNVVIGPITNSDISAAGLAGFRVTGGSTVTASNFNVQ